MSRNGSGVYSLPAATPLVTGTTISSSWANTTLSDISTALTGSVASDGQTAMTGNLQMGNNKVTGLAVATSSGDALSYGQAATVSSLTVSGAFSANGGATLGDASGDALTINSTAVSIPNGLNFDSNTLVIDATKNTVGIGTSSPVSDARLTVSSPTTESYVFFQRSNSGVFDTAIGNNGGSTVFRGGADSSTVAGLTEFMRIDSTGNVGIGVIPSAWGVFKPVQVNTAAIAGTATGQNTVVTSNTFFDGSGYKYITNGFAGFYQQNSGAHLWLYAASGTAGNSVTFAEAMRIDSSGNLLVGTTSTYSSSKFVVETAGSNGIVSKQGSAGGYGYISNALNNGGVFYHFAFQENTTLRGSITSNGSVMTYGGTSDYRLKENILPMVNGLEKVARLKPVTYTWKENGRASEGFIAHELQEVIPDAVTGAKDQVDANGNPMYQNIDPRMVVATLTAAIQELKAEVDALKAQINQ